MAVAHDDFKALSLNQIKDLFKKNTSDDQKVLIDVKGLYKASDLKVSGMRYWRL